tara:strand:+ start:375 stop:1088 length:714 start_codon:yes stop_codon:yes gene_type:complete
MSFKILVHPRDRSVYVKERLRLRCLEHVPEDPQGAYCPISLTSTPENVRDIVRQRQDLLMDQVLRPAGINPYDPGSAPYSPDAGLEAGPKVIYAVDAGRVAAGRFFTGHILLPSSGMGTEIEIALSLLKIGVLLVDKNVRISRMQPPLLYAQYEDFQAQVDEFRDLFTYLQQFQAGLGKKYEPATELARPVLIGQDPQGRVVDLEQAVNSTFPNLIYDFDGTVPILQLAVTNPEILT